jgi:TorA maturation chaperone TorD
MATQSPKRIVDELDHARAQEYALLATLLARSPDSGLLSRLAALHGDASAIGLAHAALARSARQTSEESASHEYFALFAGLGEGALLPYSSHYLAETLYGRPLVRLRQTLSNLGIEASPERTEPEDHAAFLCEIMAGLARGDISAEADAGRTFFEQHLLPWIGRFFVDVERAKSARFYSAVGALGRTFVDIEARGFELSA